MVVDYSSVDGSLLLMGFKLMAGAVASCALIGVAVVPYSRKLKVVCTPKIKLNDLSPSLI